LDLGNRPRSLTALFEQSGFSGSVGELATGLDAELAKDVRQVRARGSRGDPERATDFLVRPSRRNQSYDLELAPCQSRDTLGLRSRWRTRAQLTKLLSRRIELTLGAEMCEYFVCATKLAHRAFTIAGFGERARQLAPHARRIVDLRDCLERLSRSA
jgi:hypothetical protein